MSYLTELLPYVKCFLIFSKVIDTCNSHVIDLESIIAIEPTNGNYNLILILRNRQMRLSILVNQTHICIHWSHSVTILSLNVLIGSTWVSSLITNLTSTFILNMKEKSVIR